LAIAKAPLPEEAFYEDLCFHAQQAAEKALKAVYRHKGWIFRYTHDLDALFCGLKKEGIEVLGEVMETDVLSGYASEARYPGFDEAVTEEEYQEAIRMAEAVLAWATKQIEGPSASQTQPSSV